MVNEVQKVNAERKRQRYSKEFKLAAIKLLHALGVKLSATPVHQ